MSLGQVLPDQSIGVLIQTSLPGVMRCRKVECGVGSGFDLFVLMELGAVIRGDGANWSRLLLDELDGAFVQLTGGTGF